MNIIQKSENVRRVTVDDVTTEKVYNAETSVTEFCGCTAFLNTKTNSIDIRITAPKALNVAMTQANLTAVTTQVEQMVSACLVYEDGQTGAEYMEELANQSASEQELPEFDN